MTPYTPPEPAYFTTKNGRLWTFPDEVDQTGLELRIYTESQLRAEVERVRRETEVAIYNAAKMHGLSLIRTEAGYSLLKLGTAHGDIK